LTAIFQPSVLGSQDATNTRVAAFSALLLVVGTRLVILQSVAANTPLGLPRSVFSLQVPVSALFVLVHAADLLYRCREKLRALPPVPAAGAEVLTWLKKKT
jgi:TRAP-type C4-dicarboxylate transport system permease small subunit